MASSQVEETEAERLQREIIAAETYFRIHQALRQLPDKCRTIAQLILIEGKRTNEVADTLRIAASTVRNQKVQTRLSP